MGLWDTRGLSQEIERHSGIEIEKDGQVGDDSGYKARQTFPIPDCCRGEFHGLRHCPAQAQAQILFQRMNNEGPSKKQANEVTIPV